MCAVCGLPSTHANVTQTLGWLTVFSFTLTTFLGAWMIITSARVKAHMKTIQQKLTNKKR